MSEQDLEQVIRTRRTINNYLPERPSDETILRALDAACWAPNHKLTEPWRFYLLGPETIEKVVNLDADKTRQSKGDAAAEKRREKWSSIPGWLAVTCVCSDNAFRDRENYAAVCCAIQNLTLILWDEGIGLKWTTGDITRDPDFYDLLGIDPENEDMVGLLWYGFPNETPTSHRRPLNEVLKQLP